MRMDIDDLINYLNQIITAHGRGTFHTSPNLQSNPDVCHAACLWFLNRVTRQNLRTALFGLQTLDKQSLKIMQRNIVNGPNMLSKSVKRVKSSLKGYDDNDLSALQGMVDHWDQPDFYDDNVNDVVANIIRAMRTRSDRLMIYMLDRDGGPGHVICITRHVGSVVIYDPNIGVIVYQLRETGAWGQILKMILDWYSCNMRLTRFGFR